jgi:hypothetical protein
VRECLGAQWGQTTQQRGNAEARHEGDRSIGIASASGVKPEQRKGMGLGAVTGAISGWLRTGSRPRRREADTRGLRGIGARLAATRGRK